MSLNPLSELKLFLNRNLSNNCGWPERGPSRHKINTLTIFKPSPLGAEHWTITLYLDSAFINIDKDVMGQKLYEIDYPPPLQWNKKIWGKIYTSTIFKPSPLGAEHWTLN